MNPQPLGQVGGACVSMTALSFSQGVFQMSPFPLVGSPSSSLAISLPISFWKGIYNTSPSAPGSPRTLWPLLWFALHVLGRPILRCVALLWEGKLLRQRAMKNITLQSSVLPFCCYLDDRGNLPSAFLQCCLGLERSLKTCFKIFISLHLPQGCPPCTQLTYVTPALNNCE